MEPGAVLAWLLLAVVAAGLVALLLAVLQWRRRPRPDPDRELSSVDAGDLDAALAAIEQEEVPRRRMLLDSRLELLRERRVPVRAIRRAPGSGTARLGFADGTVLLVDAEPGVLISVAVAMTRHPVCLGSWHWTGRRHDLTLSWQPDGRVHVRAVGLDQPD